jgi:DNA primase
MRRDEFLDGFDFREYVHSRFDTVLHTSEETRVRVQCPFCNDRSYHLYILLSEGLPYCHRCNYSPRGPIKFISDLERISVGEVAKWADENATLIGNPVQEILESILSEDNDEIADVSFGSMNLGVEFASIIQQTGIPSVDKQIQAAYEYLEGRSLVRRQVESFDIRYCYEGPFSGRIVVPCYFGGEVVTFVARDLSGLDKRKYLNPKGTKQSDFLFNYDNVNSDWVILTEGVFDAINVSTVAPVVASFGKKLSQAQTSLLGKFKKVIFYWDKDAYPAVDECAQKISASCYTVLHPDDRDAGDRSAVENQYLIKGAVPVGSVKHSLYKVDQLSW